MWPPVKAKGRGLSTCRGQAVSACKLYQRRLGDHRRGCEDDGAWSEGVSLPSRNWFLGVRCSCFASCPVLVEGMGWVVPIIVLFLRVNPGEEEPVNTDTRGKQSRHGDNATTAKRETATSPPPRQPKASTGHETGGTLHSGRRIGEEPQLEGDCFRRADQFALRWGRQVSSVGTANWGVDQLKIQAGRASAAGTDALPGARPLDLGPDKFQPVGAAGQWMEVAHGARGIALFEHEVYNAHGTALYSSEPGAGRRALIIPGTTPPGNRMRK